MKATRDRISKVDWSGMYELSDINLANSFFEDRILQILNSVAPMKVSQVRKNFKSWISKDSRDLMKLRDLARSKAQLSKLHSDWTDYKILRNKCAAQCKSDKKSHFKNLYEKCDNEKDVRSLFRITKSQLGWKSSGPPSSLIVDGKLITAPQKIAEAQNKYFSDKVTSLRNTLPPVTQDPLSILKTAMDRWTKADSRPMFKLQEVSLLETVNVIKSLGKYIRFWSRPTGRVISEIGCHQSVRATEISH